MEQEMRWLEGDWKFGRFKLQIRTPHPSPYIEGEVLMGPWIDVPIAKEEKKSWCPCMDARMDVNKYYKFCPYCGTPRPS